LFPYELVRLADGENEVRITVLSPEGADLWEAEITVQSMFVTGSTLLMLFPSKPRSWAQALDRPAAGEDATWMESGNGLPGSASAARLAPPNRQVGVVPADGQGVPSARSPADAHRSGGQ